MVETAPTGTEMPWRKRNPSLNFLNVHFKKREIPFPWSFLSISSLWPVQSREQLINLLLVCDGAVCSLISASLLTQGKVEQLPENSFLPKTLFALFIFHSAKGALVGSLPLVHPKASPPAFTNCSSSPRSQDLSLESYHLLHQRRPWGAALTNKLPSYGLLPRYHHRILVCPKETMLFYTQQKTHLERPLLS